MTPYPAEAWCPGCRVTHVPGTRRCIHCGGPVLPERPAEADAGAGPAVRPGELSPWSAPAPGGAAEDAEAEARSRAVRPMRLSMALLWIVIAIATAIVRTCQERG